MITTSMKKWLLRIRTQKKRLDMCLAALALRRISLASRSPPRSRMHRVNAPTTAHVDSAGAEWETPTHYDNICKTARCIKSG